MGKALFDQVSASTLATADAQYNKINSSVKLVGDTLASEVGRIT